MSAPTTTPPPPTLPEPSAAQVAARARRYGLRPRGAVVTATWGQVHVGDFFDRPGFPQVLEVAECDVIVDVRLDDDPAQWRTFAAADPVSVLRVSG